MSSLSSKPVSLRLIDPHSHVRIIAESSPNHGELTDACEACAAKMAMGCRGCQGTARTALGSMEANSSTWSQSLWLLKLVMGLVMGLVMLVAYA